MPQVKIEYSKELKFTDNQIRELFGSINKVIVELLNVPVNGTNLRAFELDKSQVGAGENDIGFMHIVVTVLKKPERTQDILDKMCGAILNHCANKLEINKKTISVELREMDSSKYYNFKE